MRTAFLRSVTSVLVFCYLGIAAASAAAPTAAPVQVVPIDRDTVLQRHAVGDTAVAGAEKLLYSSTLGPYAVALGAGNRVADELSTVASPGCPLRRIEFPVVGRVDPSGIGGPFSVDFSLYSTCPGSVSPTLAPSYQIPGSQVHLVFPDDAPRMVAFTYPGDGLRIPSTVWFAVSFSRGNVGMVMGAPALTGNSCDLIDFPGFACNSWLGGFPEHPFANFNVELFGDADCGSSFVGYKSSRPSGPIYNPGVGITLTDDIQLGVESCRMTGYEVAVRGVGDYAFDLRTACDAAPIEGTQQSFGNSVGDQPRIARFAFDPPIDVPSAFQFAAVVNSPNSGVVISGLEPCVGATENEFEIPSELGGCFPITSPVSGTLAAINLTIYCEGEPPVGACCDMYFLDDAGEAVCREVPQMNCAFPPQGSGLRPTWVPDAACNPDPFIPSQCGRAACCKPDGTCQNLTQNECNAVEPLDKPRLWLRGQNCNSGTRCPPSDCLGAEGSCSEPHATPGCSDLECCANVCQLDPFCCQYEWDVECVFSTYQGACELPMGNDVCAPTSRYAGAHLLTIPLNGFATATTSVSWATENDSDPGFGCYKNDPGQAGLHTVWYKFIAPPPIAPATKTNVNLSTCSSGHPADDSLIQLFAVGDPTNEFTQCNSLIPYACNDDFASTPCNRVATLSRVCARELIPGNLYYVMVASKVAVTNVTAEFRLDISNPSSCLVEPAELINDFCPRATTILDGVTPFSLASPNPRYSLDWVEVCAPSMTADMWFDYTASCTGTLIVHTCGASAPSSLDTNLVIYPGEACPIPGAPPLGCSADAGGDCGLASKVSMDVTQGQALKIRVGDNVLNAPSGNLTIACTPATCPAGAIAIVTDGPLGIPPEAIDARRPNDPENPSQLLTTQTFQVTTTRDAQASCFSFCETADTGAPNSIAEVAPGAIDGPLQVYTITLARPITPGAKTTITYTPDAASASHVRLYSHPGNVNPDSTANENDIAALRVVFDAIYLPPYGLLSYDLDRSGVITPADLLEEVDLLNGAGGFDSWLGTLNPNNHATCP